MINLVSHKPVSCYQYEKLKFVSELLSFTGYCFLNPDLIGCIKIIAIHSLGSLVGNYFGQKSSVLTNEYLQGSFTKYKSEKMGRISGQWIGSVASVLSYTYFQHVGYGELEAITASAAFSFFSAALLGSSVISCDPTLYLYDLENPSYIRNLDPRAMST